MKYINIDIKKFREGLMSANPVGIPEPAIPSQDENINPEQEQEVQGLKQQLNEAAPTINFGMEEIPLVPSQPRGGGGGGEFPIMEKDMGGYYEGEEAPMMQDGGFVSVSDGSPLRVTPESNEEYLRLAGKAAIGREYAMGNPSVKRMIQPVNNTYKFDDGNEGTHYMSSMDNYAVPFIQEGSDRNLFMNENANPSDREAIKFNTAEEAEWFANENYKSIKPSKQFMPDNYLTKNSGNVNEFQQGGVVGNPPIYVDSKNDPRYRAYNDSLNLYNYSNKLVREGLGYRSFSFPENPKLYEDYNIPYNPTGTRLTSNNEVYKIGVAPGDYGYGNINYRNIVEKSLKTKNKPLGWTYSDASIPVYKKPTQPIKVEPIQTIELPEVTVRGERPKPRVASLTLEKRITTHRDLEQFKKSKEYGMYDWEAIGDGAGGTLNLRGKIKATPVEEFRNGGEPTLPFLVNPSTGRTGNQPIPRNTVDNNYLQMLNTFGTPSDGTDPFTQVPNVELEKFRAGLPYLKNAPLSEVKKHYEISKSVRQNQPATISQEYRTPQILDRDAKAVQLMQNEKLGIMDLPLTILNNPLGAVGEALEASGFKNQPFGNYEQERSRVMQNRYNPYFSNEQRLASTLQQASELGTGAALNLGLTGALMPKASAGRILGESLLPFGSVDDIVNPLSNIGRKAKPNITSSVDNVGDSNIINAISSTKNHLSRAAKGSKSIVGEIIGEIGQGKINRESIQKGNEWLENWINHPTTQGKIDNSIDYMKTFVDEFSKNPKETEKLLELIRTQSKNFKPDSKEFSLLEQFKDNLNQYFSKESMDPIHQGNWGVSYKHGVAPIFRDAIDIGMPPDARYGSWISRSSEMDQKHRIATTIHEGTHDWVSSDAFRKSGMRHTTLKNVNPEFKKDFSEWEEHRLYGRDPVKEMGKERAYRGYLANPTEVHARIMELRKGLSLSPKNVVSPEYAELVIEWIESGGSTIDPEFLKVFDSDPKKLSNLFNKLWTVPATMGIGAGALNQTNKDDKNKTN